METFVAITKHISGELTGRLLDTFVKFKDAFQNFRYLWVKIVASYDINIDIIKIICFT
jgi:hypothetical protein